MELIDKAAVVAEIEKLISGLRRNCNPNPLGNMQECLAAAQIEAINLIKDFLDTMEVKEVDLDLGSSEGDMSVKTIWYKGKIVSQKAQKGE